MAWTNELALIIVDVFLGLGCLACGKRRANRWVSIFGLVVFAAAGWLVYWAGPDISRWHLPSRQLGALPAGLLLGTFAWADAIGLPRRLALQLGVGRREPRIYFNNVIDRTNERLFAELQQCVTDQKRHDRHLRTARALADRLAEFPAPDEAWGTCRDDIVALHRKVIASVAAHVSGEESEDTGPGSQLEAAYRPNTARRVELWEEAARDRVQSAEEDSIRWSLTLLVTGWLATALSVGSYFLGRVISPPVYTDPWLWLEACAGGVAAWLVLYAAGRAVLKAIRR